MTPDQLAAARANHWHQDARPLLTLEDATSWIEQMQLALYLPRRSHVLAPAPSFVEAVAGKQDATSAPDAIASASALLVRLVQEGTVVPLNLFGTPGEQPDFLVATTALPHLAALQADRNWKKPPSRTGPGKVSPMAVEVWKLLDHEGALTANEIREQLGHELTEAATIRGLSELWQNMRVAPLPSENGESANWQILSVTHKKEMAAGGTMSQSAALSMLVSNYLQSIITGTAEDIEAFLSPVASRSRLRDVVRGLTATRQLRTLSMDAQTFLFIDGTLPEMPEVAATEAPENDAKPAFMGRSAYRERMLNRGKEDESQPGAVRDDKEASNRERPAFRSDRPQRFAAGGGSTFRKRPAASSDRDKPGRPSFGRPPADRPNTDGSTSDRGSSRPPRFGNSSAAPRIRDSRPGSDRPDRGRAGSNRTASRSFRPAAGRPGEEQTGAGRPRRFGAGKFASGDRPHADRPFSKGGERGGFRAQPGGGRRPDRPASGARSPFREGGGDRGARPFRPRADGERPQGAKRPFRPRDEAGSDSRNSSRAGFQSRTGGRVGRSAGDRPRPDRAMGDRPSSGRPRPPRAEGDRPFIPRPRSGGAADSRTPRRFDDAKPSFQRRDSRSSADSRSANGGRPPKREGTSSGYPSNPNRPSRAPRPAGNFDRRRSGSSDRRPGNDRPGEDRPSNDRPGNDRPGSSGFGGAGRSDRTPARGGRPAFKGRPGGADRSGGPGRPPGRNPGGTGRPGGPRTGGGRSFGPGARTNSARPGGMKPPTRKPRPEKESE